MSRRALLMAVQCEIHSVSLDWQWFEDIVLWEHVLVILCICQRADKDHFAFPAFANCPSRHESLCEDLCSSICSVLRNPFLWLHSPWPVTKRISRLIRYRHLYRSINFAIRRGLTERYPLLNLFGIERLNEHIMLKPISQHLSNRIRRLGWDCLLCLGRSGEDSLHWSRNHRVIFLSPNCAFCIAFLWMNATTGWLIFAVRPRSRFRDDNILRDTFLHPLDPAPAGL